ncbi:Alpha/Beta hydrolase protein [Aspergillus unguis]
MASAVVLAGWFILSASATTLGQYRIDPDSISVSGFSSGGFMAAQLGVAYSSIFKPGFGVFAGGPYDCARDQPNSTCMFNNVPSITTPTENMVKWSGDKIDDVANLKERKVYIQTGALDRVIGPNIVGKLNEQLARFTDPRKTIYIVTEDAGHTFPTDLDSPGNIPCQDSESPYISNCGFDGAGEVLKWLYGDLKPRTETLTGDIVPFEQTGEYGGDGMSKTAYLYVPERCKELTCRLHVVLHGCTQTYDIIGDKFVNNTGYNQWADTNDIVLLYPQTTVDNTLRPIWDGKVHSNSLACWDWIGYYGEDIDQKGGVQIAAIINQIKRISRPTTNSESTHREL